MGARSRSSPGTEARKAHWRLAAGRLSPIPHLALSHPSHFSAEALGVAQAVLAPISWLARPPGRLHLDLPRSSAGAKGRCLRAHGCRPGATPTQAWRLHRTPRQRAQGRLHPSQPRHGPLQAVPVHVNAASTRSLSRGLPRGAPQARLYEASQGSGSPAGRPHFGPRRRRSPT